VPAEAVQVNGDSGIVFVVRGDKVEQRAVKLGAQSAQGQVVLSGIDAGARLAVPLQGKLSDGMAIRVQNQ
jgi:hypothetical protein